VVNCGELLLLLTSSHGLHGAFLHLLYAANTAPHAELSHDWPRR